MNAAAHALLKLTDQGLYCERGGFFVDPWRAVDRAIVTHAHSDHLARGCGRYLTAQDGLTITRARLNDSDSVTGIDHGKVLDFEGVKVSLHPAGHIRGSAQVRLEYQGEVWVVSGDYKLAKDPTCAPFEPVRCHVFISECTFGLPVYRWPDPDQVIQQILRWWRANQEAGRASLLLAYSLGKAQRVLATLAEAAGAKAGGGLPGRIYVHGAVEAMNTAYRQSGVILPETHRVANAEKGEDWSQALVIAPPSAYSSAWARRFEPCSAALVSGWMRIRGARRRQALDRGFVISDHADWPGLRSAIEASGPEKVWLTHGYTAAMVRWLIEQGVEAQALSTQFRGERDEEEPATEPGSDFTAITP